MAAFLMSQVRTSGFLDRCSRHIGSYCLRVTKLISLDLRVIGISPIVSRLTFLVTVIAYAALAQNPLANWFGRNSGVLRLPHHSCDTVVIDTAAAKDDKTSGYLLGQAPLGECLTLADNGNDRRLYAEAVRLLGKGRYASAYDRLVDLGSMYQGRPFGQCVMLKIADCMNLFNDELKAENARFDPIKATNLLETVLDTHQYSPVLFESFWKWRTLTQEIWYGMSNFSEIPHTRYEQKKRSVIETICGHIRNQPKDRWAAQQLRVLLALPRLGCAGPAGNDNLAHWFVLFRWSQEPERISAGKLPCRYNAQ